MRTTNLAGSVLLALLALTGCSTRGENIPIEEARNRVIVPDVERRQVMTPAQVTFPNEVVRVGSGLWQAGFRDHRLPERSVQQVGSAAGLTFYALAWDNDPYDRLLVPVPGWHGLYREFLSVY